MKYMSVNNKKSFIIFKSYIKWKQKKLVILQAGYLLKSNKLIST